MLQPRGATEGTFLHEDNLSIVETSPSHQEDYHAIAALSLDPEGLRRSIQKTIGIDWKPENALDPIARQVVFVGMYDGYVNHQTLVAFYRAKTNCRHGGSTVSQYLRQELHGLFESVDKSHIPELFLWIKDLGGYFKRFTGGVLAPWIHGLQDTPPLDLEARATQAFFEVGKDKMYCL